MYSPIEQLYFDNFFRPISLIGTICRTLSEAEKNEGQRFFLPAENAIRSLLNFNSYQETSNSFSIVRSLSKFRIVSWANCFSKYEPTLPRRRMKLSEVWNSTLSIDCRLGCDEILRKICASSCLRFFRMLLDMRFDRRRLADSSRGTEVWIAI